MEISCNTLEVIQVKDSGYGIAAEDRKLLGKRYCTSKIRDMGDLRSLGGTSLGFRGEALASAIETARCVEVVTRSDGEPAAEKIVLERHGQLPRCLSSGFLSVAADAHVYSIGRQMPATRSGPLSGCRSFFTVCR